MPLRPVPLLAVLGTLVLAALLWATTLPDLAGSFLGRPGVDAYGTQWFYWFVERQARRLEPFGRTDLFFFPYGKDVYLHTGSNVLDALLAVPFRLLLGPVLGYDVFVLAGLLATGLAFHGLARDLAGDGLAAAVGAVLFTVTPYALLELADGRPTQAILALPVLFLRCLWRTGLAPGWRAPVTAGALLALCGYQYWYYAIFGALLGLVLAAWSVLRPADGAGGRGAVLGRFLLAGGVSIALAAPGAVPLLLASSGDAVPGLLDVEAWSLLSTPPVTAQAQSVGLLLWQPLRLAAGTFAQSRTTGEEQFLVGAHWTPWVLLPLVVAGLVRPGRLPRAALLLLLAAGTLLAMGPLLLVGPYALPNPLYIALVKVVPPLQRLWWPGRCYAFVAILLGLAAVRGLALAGRRPWLALGLSLAALAGTAWHLHGERILPFPTWSAEVPAGYRCLAGGPPGALVELPYSWSQAHLYYQTVHGRPILGGMIEDNASFTPPEASALKKDNRWLGRLLRLTGMSREDTEWTEAERQAIHELGFRYVVLQKDAFLVQGDRTTFHREVLRTRLRRLLKDLVPLVGEPVFEDARTAVYAPWGDPAPCDPRAIGFDREAQAPPAPDADPGTMPGPEPLERVLPDP